MSNLGVVSAGHELTAQAGEEILRAGGNAYDAILACMLASTVCEPVLSSMAGGGFLLAQPADAKPCVYDFFVQTPLRKKPKEDVEFTAVMADYGGKFQEFHAGKAAMGVPGQVLGAFEIHKDLGSMPIKDIFAPAIKMAKEGVVTNGYQSFLFGVVKEVLQGGCGAETLFDSRMKEGALLQEGEVLKLPELAGFLETLSIEGPDLFYRGEVAQTIASDMADGGLITLDDLKGYRVERRKPLSLSYQGVEVSMNTPPASGGLLIAFGLQLLQHTDIGKLKHGEPEFWRILIDVLEQTVAARMVLDDMECIEQRAAAIFDEKFIRQYADVVQNHKQVSRGTTHISVIDGQKNMASMTVSNGEGNNYRITGAGIMTNNIMGEDDVNPGGCDGWTPDTRLSSMMCPATLRWKDGRCMAIGTGGANRIRTAMLQLIVNLVDYDMHAEEAVCQDRIHFENNRLDMEMVESEALLDMAKRYDEYHFWDTQTMFFGGTHIAGFDQKGFDGAGDPRRSGVCRIV